MATIPWLVPGIKAILEAKRIIDYERKRRELEQWHGAKVLESFRGYERLVAELALLSADFILEFSQAAERGQWDLCLRLEEAYAIHMEQSVARLQRELESQPATKYDVARLVIDLQRLAVDHAREFSAQKAATEQALRVHREDVDKALARHQERIESETSSRLADLRREFESRFLTLESSLATYRTAVEEVARRTDATADALRLMQVSMRRHLFVTICSLCLTLLLLAFAVVRWRTG